MVAANGCEIEVLVYWMQTLESPGTYVHAPRLQWMVESFSLDMLAACNPLCLAEMKRMYACSCWFLTSYVLSDYITYWLIILVSSIWKWRALKQFSWVCRIMYDVCYGVIVSLFLVSDSPFWHLFKFCHAIWCRLWAWFCHGPAWM